MKRGKINSDLRTAKGIFTEIMPESNCMTAMNIPRRADYIVVVQNDFFALLEAVRLYYGIKKFYGSDCCPKLVFLGLSRFVVYSTQINFIFFANALYKLGIRSPEENLCLYEETLEEGLQKFYRIAGGKEIIFCLTRLSWFDFSSASKSGFDYYIRCSDATFDDYVMLYGQDVMLHEMAEIFWSHTQKLADVPSRRHLAEKYRLKLPERNFYERLRNIWQYGKIRVKLFGMSDITEHFYNRLLADYYEMFFLR